MPWLKATREELIEFVQLVADGNTEITELESVAEGLLESESEGE